MKRVALVLGGVGGCLGLVAAIALLIPLCSGTVTFTVGVRGLFTTLLAPFDGSASSAVMGVLVALHFCFALLGIAAVVYAPRHTKLCAILFIIAGIGLALSGGAGFWVTSPLLVGGGILILLAQRKGKSQA